MKAALLKESTPILIIVFSIGLFVYCQQDNSRCQRILTNFFHGGATCDYDNSWLVSVVIRIMMRI